MNSGITEIRNHRPVMQVSCYGEKKVKDKKRPLDLALPLFCRLLRSQLLQLQFLPGGRDRGDCSRVVRAMLTFLLGTIFQSPASRI